MTFVAPCHTCGGSGWSPERQDVREGQNPEKVYGEDFRREERERERELDDAADAMREEERDDVERDLRD